MNARAWILIATAGCWAAGCGRPAETTPAGGGGTAPVAAGGQTPADHVHGAGVPDHDHGPGADHSHGPTVAPEEARRRVAEANYLADLGSVHLNHGKVDEAVKTLEQAVAAGRGIADNALHHYALAKAYQAKRDTAGYEKNLRESVRIYTKLHADAVEAQQKPGAAPDVRAGQAKNFWCERLSELNRGLGDPQKAVEWADQVAAEGDPDPTALKVKARLYAQNGLSAKALTVLEDAEKRAMPGMQRERVSYDIADALANLLRRPDDAVGRLKILAETASEPGLRDQAKRLLFQIYDAKGDLDKLKLGGEAGAAPSGGTGKKPGGA